MNVIEYCAVVFGVLLNSLLLFLIFRFTRPNLGNYKNLLKIFACNDIIMVIIHAFVQPATVTSGSALGVFSIKFPDDKYLISMTCGWFTVPCALMNINFLHRYWSVRSPERVVLFSKPSFAIKIAPYPIALGILWAFASLAVADNSIGKAMLQPSVDKVDGIRMGKGWLILHFWENGKLNVHDLCVLIFEGTLFVSNCIAAVILFGRTIYHLRKEHTISKSYKAFQFKILRALVAQSAIPIIFVYIPFGVGIPLPLVFSDFRKGGLDLILRADLDTLISSFPALDAIVIILLMKDYRDGLISLLFPKQQGMTVSMMQTTQISRKM